MTGLTWGQFIYMGRLSTSSEPHRSGLFRRLVVSGTNWTEAAKYAAFWTAILALAEPEQALALAKIGRVRTSDAEIQSDMRQRIEQYSRDGLSILSTSIVDDIASTFFFETSRDIPARHLASAAVRWNYELLAFDAFALGLTRPADVLLWPEIDTGRFEFEETARRLHALWLDVRNG